MATNGQAHGEWQATGVAIDSRSLATGDLFVALRGPNRDAHEFVAAALGAGAAAAVVERVPEGLPANAPLLKVDDTQLALENLGGAARARSAARVVAVTGSVGKTGIKEALRHVLGRQGPTHASAASYNNHWGVPLTLARMSPNSAYSVLELGMNHAGELAALTAQVRPHVALVTTVEPAHLEFFGSIEAIADAKAEIFQGLEPGGVAVLNRDNPMYTRLRAEAERYAGQIVSFGTHCSADVRLGEVALDAHGSDVRAGVCGRALSYRIGIAGRHWVLNSLGVLAAVAALGADPAAAAAALADLPPPSGRGARHEISLQGGRATLLDESYNANPASVRAALDVLGRIPGRRIAVLGDMRELGPKAGELHAELAEAVCVAGVARLYTCGPLMEQLFAAVPPGMRAAHAAESQSLLPLVLAGIAPGDVVLVKGSLGSRMAPIVEALRQGRPAARGAG